MEPQVLERAQHPISRRDIDPNVLKVLYRLIQGGHTAFLVGGGVRDLMLAGKPKDFDVATSAHPSQVRELFRNSRLIGRRFKLIHVFFGRQNIEVATFRRQAEELAENGADLLIRHDNTFGTAEEDAFRRDFTVNALFYDPKTFHLIDYVGGVADLRARLIRLIGDPELRVREDPVRMLRAVRFAAKLDFEIEEATRRAIERHHAEILRTSPPRLVEEIYRTIGQPAADRALVLMEQLGLLGVLLPRLSVYLKEQPTGPQESLTCRNLRTLGESIERGNTPDHAFMLACLFLDLHRALYRAPGAPREYDLREELRAQGFARSDTEHMRLLMDAFDLLVSRSRRAHRLARRPYFPDARRFYEILAANYGANPAELAHIVAAPHAFHPRGVQGAEPRPGRRRRRRMRGGRRHRERRFRARHAASAGAAPSDPGASGGPHEAAPHDRAPQSAEHEATHRSTTD